MRRWLVPTAIVAAAVGLNACQRTEEKVNTRRRWFKPVHVPAPVTRRQRRHLVHRDLRVLRDQKALQENPVLSP